MPDPAAGRVEAVGKLAAEPPVAERLPVHRASVVHVDDLDAPEVVVGAVDDPVAAPSGRTQAGQLAAQRPAETIRVLRQGTEDELDASGGDLLG